MVACLAGSTGTVASHLSAAALFGLAKPPARAPGRTRASARRVAIRRAGRAPPEARLQRRLIEWGFPRAERQVEVFDQQGNFVAGLSVGIRELKVLFEYDSDEHHGPRCWIADDDRKERLEALGWIVVAIDRFDLRPSSTRLRDELERISLSRSTAHMTAERGSEPQFPAQTAA